MGRPIYFLVATILGFSCVAFADDRSVDAPKKTNGSGFLGGLTPLSAGSLMADEAPKPPAVESKPLAPVPPEWTVKGFAELAYGWNTNSPENVPPSSRPAKENALRVFDVNHNEFTLHNVELDVEKAATEASWVGFRAVAMAGQDAKFIHSAGLFDGGTGAASGNGEDFDLIDAYATILVPKRILPFSTTFKLGKWETHHGYEVIHSPLNPNYSRSYLFGFAIPFTHTGIMADTTWVERPEGKGPMLGTGLGIVNGWDNVKDNNDSKSLMGQIRFQPCDFFETHTEVMFGPEQENDDANWRGLVDINATVTPFTGFMIGGNYDYGYEEHVPFATANAGYVTWYGFAGYVKYTPTFCECLKKWHVAFRGEWFNDPDGVRTGNSTAAGAVFVRNGNDFVGLTTTIGYQPIESLLIRLEHRWDKADDDVFNEEGDGTSHRNYQNTVAIDVVVFY